ncbi:MAG: TetR/AcrR family transcriptional regulator [Sphingomonadales bacterium]|nr:TetR/AcrR family transcriptional regulator [Sphingomonadales bacterium]
MEQTGRKPRVRRDPQTTRALILDTTERLMVEEGYAAVSTRRIAQELGLNAATIHYYYPATDDVFVALHQRMTDRQQADLAAALAAPDPLAAFWDLQVAPARTALGVEFLALANHRKALGSRIAAVTDAAREATSRLLAGSLDDLTVNGAALAPPGITALLTAIGRLLANEERVGITHGHPELRAFVAALLRRRRSG